MKKLWILTIVLGTPCGTWADTLPTPPTKVHPPYFLQNKDKIPNQELASPDIPAKDSDGQALDAPENILPPATDVMDRFSDPPFFEEIRVTKGAETKIQRLYWHKLGDLDYCHYKDTEGNHWYGWVDEDGNFNWILWRGHRYWWHDPFAGHWLYYFQDCWWRSDGQAKGTLQACIDGEYYLCDVKGNVLKDMGGDGNGAIVSAPGKYRGDFHHGGHGSRPGGPRPANNNQPSQNGTQNSNQVGTSTNH